MIASTSPSWTPLVTVTDARAPSAPARPPALPPAAGSALPPAVTLCWWRRRSLMKPPLTLGSLHPQGPHPLEVKSAETPLWPPPVPHEGAATPKTCRDATWRAGTPSVCHRLRPAAVSSASHRKPGRRHWNRHRNLIHMKVD